ncbi:MAG: hypothetical protein ACXV3U_07095 [Halobacteriota archaeon]
MKVALRRGLVLLSVLLVSGIIAGTGIIALGAQKAIPGTSNHYVSVVKAPQAGQPLEQQSERHALYEARVKSLAAIANRDERVQTLVAEKQSTVIGVKLSQGPSADENDILLLKVNGTFYRIAIDTVHEKVISVEPRTCYGPVCNA